MSTLLQRNLQSHSHAAGLRAASLGKMTVTIAHATCHMHCICSPFIFHMFPSAEQKNRGQAEKNILRDTCSIICLVQIFCR